MSISSRIFNRLLVANRGEIALRVMRTARKMGLSTVAVYSDADQGAPHTLGADAIWRLGPAPASQSYLSIAAIIDAARHTEAEAIHPGYGFLAENPAFASAVLEAGLVWVGPPPSAMESMGNKARARVLMQERGVPCLPGYEGEVQDINRLETEAIRIGFPLMIKAVAGGGGRGLRRVEKNADFRFALERAMSEAATAFGDGRVLLERALDHPRHIEVQVFADTHGHVVHIGERDCSVQRRHQKIIEEAPSPVVSPSLRREMGAMAVTATRAVDYCGAGTIECLLGSDGHYWFMEMNTRLQVEHPVTEALTGFDLVEWQLRVAMGEPLPVLDQEQILRRYEQGGHAIEVRLCAEDAARHFLPQAGAVLVWQSPQGLRVEHALSAGRPIPPDYDSMVAKIISHAADRHSAIRQLVKGLSETVLLGVTCNRDFLIACLQHPEFIASNASTQFIANYQTQLLAAIPVFTPSQLALLIYIARVIRDGGDASAGDLVIPWSMPLLFSIDTPDAVTPVSLGALVLPLGQGRYRVQLEGDPSKAQDIGEQPAGVTDLYQVESAQYKEYGEIIWLQDGQRMRVIYVQQGDKLFVSSSTVQMSVQDHTLAIPKSSESASEYVIRAEMPGRVTQITASVGDKVSRGSPLVTLEAMKMEHPSLARRDAVVKAVLVSVGQQVAVGDILIELSPQSPHS